MSAPAPYVGRFAPSPTGPLHAGSVVAALASWLDARAHRGRWLLRIEDLDPPREQPGAAASIVDTLGRLGLHPDGEIVVQSTRGSAYAEALGTLVARGLGYPCGCTRREIADSVLHAGGTRTRTRHGELRYPGTCRDGLAPGRTARAWRLRVPDGVVRFEDRRLGTQSQDIAAEIGDFVLKRADGLWAYQLAVVVDDTAQGVTDVVRGTDLLGSTGRQVVLARALGLPSPRWLHVPVVAGADGDKLSKQTGATAVDASRPLEVLGAAMRHLGLEPPADAPLDAWLADATARWAARRLRAS
ncbi:MAG: tRNA glutamyl-Q(34) synthetase GluQRS [Burkholderiales bacterium]|nr:tRNA glutamyl-Q(34) synthetase GluQRS [Burkholderiales bacterium]MCZ8101854.1 tRNA glutamyl-Q(34) synthetase GluQRS [Burkholderiales bacterium]